MKAVIDNALQLDELARLEELFEPGRNLVTSKPFAAALAPVTRHVAALAGAVVLVGAYCVATQPGHEGSPPHYDENGPTAVLHLSDVEGGQFLFLDDDAAVVEFVRNRLVVWSEECRHMHRPHRAGVRCNLVTRYRYV